VRLFLTATAVFDIINIIINDDIIGATQGLRLIYAIKVEKHTRKIVDFDLFVIMIGDM